MLGQNLVLSRDYQRSSFKGLDVDSIDNSKTLDIL